jgi:hypothetical protein
MQYNDKPETVRQAVRWDNRYNEYEQKGLCPACAARAAWGHQIGSRRVGTVCTSCQALMPLAGEPATESAVCSCGSLISGSALWGSEWGGSCDRAERRVTALMERLNDRETASLS